MKKVLSEWSFSLKTQGFLGNINVGFSSSGVVTAGYGVETSLVGAELMGYYTYPLFKLDE